LNDFPDFVYWLLSFPVFKGVVFGGLVASFLLGALIEFLNWRRG
jgi:hypothetical protein